MHPPLLAARATSEDVGGLTGALLDVIRAIGELGVLLLVAVEHIVPPIPSEVVLPFSGALVSDGRFSFWGVLLAATLGAVVGGWALYELGRAFGRERVLAGLSRVPLVHDDDVRRADAWFERHGEAAVLTGRLLPGVRSLVSVPAGAQRMPRPRYLLLTAIGSAVWNAALIGIGVGLGRDWERIERYSTWIDVVLVAAVVVVVARGVRREVRSCPAPTTWGPTPPGRVSRATVRSLTR